LTGVFFFAAVGKVKYLATGLTLTTEVVVVVPDVGVAEDRVVDAVGATHKVDAAAVVGVCQQKFQLDSVVLRH
jgi:hypothetical protein